MMFGETLTSKQEQSSLRRWRSLKDPKSVRNELWAIFLVSDDGFWTHSFTSSGLPSLFPPSEQITWVETVAGSAQAAVWRSGQPCLPATEAWALAPWEEGPHSQLTEAQTDVLDLHRMYFFQVFNSLQSSCPVLFKLSSVTCGFQRGGPWMDFGGVWGQDQEGGSSGQTLGVSCNESMPLLVLQTKGLCTFSLRKTVLFKNIWF